MFALLGPNGSGKTTTVQILSTLVPADADELRVADHDVRSDPDGVRAAIGVTRQFSTVDDPQNLRLMAPTWSTPAATPDVARVAVPLERPTSSTRPRGQRPPNRQGDT